MPQPTPSSVDPGKLRRSLYVALFVTALLWYALADALAARAARGLTTRFHFEDVQPLLSALFLVFLLALGFRLFERLSKTGQPGTMRQTLGLPRRPTAGREWTLGAALGWGAAVAAVLPMALGRTLHVRFWTAPRAFTLLVLHAATLLVAALATETALRGLPFRRLITALGPAWATAAMAILLGLAHALTPDATALSTVGTILATILLSVAWLRTHGLWLPWGLHFAWNASVGLLFGLPLRGVNTFSSVIQTRAIGSAWLTGLDFGPEAAFFTLIVSLIALVILVRTTGDYAWDYTRPAIIAAGYEVNPAPSPAHTAMEQEAIVRPPTLVQILPSTPQSRSAIEDH